MTTVLAHFDGRVLVPDEPVNLPTNCPLQLDIHEVHKASAPSITFDMRNGIPVVRVPPGTRPMTPEDVKNALDD